MVVQVFILPCLQLWSPVANVEIDLQFIVTLIAVVIISSFGVAGVGGGATFASILVLSTLNLPVALPACSSPLNH